MHVDSRGLWFKVL